MISQLREMQERAKIAEQNVRPKRRMVRYTPAEWELLAEAMVAELLAAPENLGLTLSALANQAQRTQKQILLGEHYGSGVEWEARSFSAGCQLTRAVESMFGLLKKYRDTYKSPYALRQENTELLARERTLLDRVAALTTKVEAMQTTEQLLAHASAENQKLVAEVANLRKELDGLRNRKPDLHDFSDADIMSQAAFIQAEQAERMEEATRSVTSGIARLTDLLNNHQAEIRVNIAEATRDTTQGIKTVMEEWNRSVQPMPPRTAPMIRHNKKRH